MANSEPLPMDMKLLIDTQSKRVLFAEASKDLVDFLFYILSLPIATVVTLIKNQGGKGGMVGSLGHLYQSIQNLPDSCLQYNQSKDAILKPMQPRCGSPLRRLLFNDASFRFQTPSALNNNSGFGFHKTASSSSSSMSGTASGFSGSIFGSVPTSTDEGGYVKGVVTYMVMDNLDVKPLSTISSITLINTLKVKDLGSLEERVVTLGVTEAVKLLKASLQSEQVLTDVFIKDEEV